MHKGRTLTTEEAAYWAGVPYGSFARWARRLGLRPVFEASSGRRVKYWSEVDMLIALGLLDRNPKCEVNCGKIGHIGS